MQLVRLPNLRYLVKCGSSIESRRSEAVRKAGFAR